MGDANPFIRELRERHALNTRVFVQLAEELRKEGELDEALRVCRDGLERHPTYASAHVTLGRVLMDRGDPAAARGAFQAGLSLSPRNALALRMLGECLERLGAVEDARAAYRSALEIDPDESILERLRGLPEAPAPPREGPAQPPAPAQPPPVPTARPAEHFELLDPFDIPATWGAAPAGAAPPPAEPAPSLPAPEASGWPEFPASAEAPAAAPLADFPELLQALHQQRFSGSLVASRPGVEKTVRLREGRLVFASSTSSDDRLGDLLFRRGRISLEQWRLASETVGDGRRLGAVLVRGGVLEPRELVGAVVEQTREIIYGLFQWTDGDYRLEEGDPEPEDVTLRISTPDVILEGIRRIDSWARVERAVGGPEARYARAEAWQAAAQQLGLSALQREILAGHRGVEDVQSICARSALHGFEVCRTLWALRVLGLLRRVG